MAEENGLEKKAKTGFDGKIIIIGMVFFLVAVGASYLIMDRLLAPLMPPKADSAEVKVGALLSVGEFTTNINDVNGTRFLKVEVTIETDEKKKEDVNKNMAVIKDTILNTFAGKTVADLDIRNRDNLKAEITRQLNAKLGAEVIRNVYFTKFIMQ
ncbi:MAG TPA: flagellar basal body protein FliL [Syntrophomonas sp.]|jgi:flagellar FliL protein|nr:flagellar basal body protein FliL [Syntrophomonas sp.]